MKSIVKDGREKFLTPFPTLVNATAVAQWAIASGSIPDLNKDRKKKENAPED